MTSQAAQRLPLSPRQAALWMSGVAWYLAAAWLLVQRGLSPWLADNPSLNFYLVQPAIWLGLAALAYAGWRRLPDRPAFSRVLTGIALLLGAFHVGLLVFGGILGGFGESMVAGRIANYPRNLWFVGTWLLGLEMARAFLFHAWCHRSRRWAFIGTTVILTVAMTPYGQLNALTSGDTAIETLGGFLLPTVVLSILATWLVDHGGPGPAIAYRGALLAFEWFSQVQPDLEWPILFFVGVAGPMLGARFIRSIYLSTEEGRRRWDDHPAVDEGPTAHPYLRFLWSGISVVLVLAVLGVGALLGFGPGVVSGISMEPSISRGDLVILQRNIDPAVLAVGDVVEFAGMGGPTIIHRIIAIDDTAAGLVFTTQGDNNPRPDPQFTADQVRGKVVSKIPVIGWPAIWVQGG